MRVLLSASTFPLRRADGTPAFVFGLARALAQRGEVTVLVPGAVGIPHAEVWDDVRIRRFDYFWPRARQRLAYGDGMEVNLSRSWAARLQVPGFLAAQLWATCRLIAELRPDVVNSHWMLPQGLTAALARGRGARFGHVVTLHGGDAHLLTTLAGGRPLARFVARRADAFLASSEAVRAALDALLGRASACTAPVTPAGCCPTASSSSRGGPTTRSSSAGSASNSGRSRRCLRNTHRSSRQWFPCARTARASHVWWRTS